MRLKNVFLPFFLLFFFSSFSEILAKNVETKDYLENENQILNEAIDLHLTNAVAPLNNSTVTLSSEEAWLFFDNMKPSVVLSNYSSKIFINGAALNVNVNARVSVYMNGTIIIPHSSTFKPLQVYSENNFAGNSANYALDYYYTNAPGQYVPDSLVLPLGIEDNSIRSIKLKKGYMATLANNPDGTGYSRIFIADTADINLSQLPDLLDKKISFIRIFRWDWVSKKGWCGTTDVEAQADQVDCTWFYSWGAGNKSTNNLEYCPEKWGPDWPGWDEITAKTGVAHLLGYNEPDHSEQSNASVDKAVADWPKALQTGLRLGSPATTDFNWLYQFMDECKAKNYRVDYVAIHGYWGGKSPQNWYNDLRTIHEKTGRPIWLTEWNNGANWTNESWPSSSADQFQKQLSDLKAILNVLDTAKFVERYSIYNWVEDKRAMILNWSSTTLKGDLTPAGAYYKSDKSELAFDARNEVIPSWKIYDTPVLSYDYAKENNQIHLSWTDYNDEMISSYIIERSRDNEVYNEINRLEVPYLKEYSDPLLDTTTVGSVYYRIKSVGYDGTIKASNVVKYEYLKNEKEVTIGELSVPTNDWSLYAFNKAYMNTPVVVFGTPTYNNKVTMSHRANDLDKSSFEFKLDTWVYLADPVFTTNDSIAYIALAPGTYDLNGVTAKAGNASGITSNWTKVSFDSPFSQVPVVFGTQVTNNSAPTTSVRVRNVTTDGFEVKLQYEEAVTPGNVGESVCYIAMTPGTGSYDGKKIQVGRTADLVVGNYFSANRIEFGGSYIEPAFFGFMQTESDGIASTLRIKKRGATFAEVFKDREISKSTKAVSKETVGWFVAETGSSATAIQDIQDEKIEIIFDPATDRICLAGSKIISKAEVYSLLGKKLISKKTVYDLDVSMLSPGVYILSINGTKNMKFVKK